MATPSYQVANNLSATNKMRLRIAVDNAGDTPAAVPNVYAITGCANTAAQTLPGGTTYSGDFTSFAELQDYLQKNKLYITSIKLQTSNTDNFAETLVIGERMPNNKNPKEQEFNLVDFRKSTGNGFADDLTIDATALGGGIVMKSNVYFRFSNILKNSFVTMWLGVALMENIADLQAISQ